MLGMSKKARRQTTARIGKRRIPHASISFSAKLSLHRKAVTALQLNNWSPQTNRREGKSNLGPGKATCKMWRNRSQKQSLWKRRIKSQTTGSTRQELHENCPFLLSNKVETLLLWNERNAHTDSGMPGSQQRLRIYASDSVPNVCTYNLHVKLETFQTKFETLLSKVETFK